MKKTKYLALLCAVVCLITALSVPASAASSVTDQMAANSAAWWVAHNAGDTATCEALHEANVALANQAASGGGSANFNSASGTWDITTSSGSNISSSGSSNGKSNGISYTTTTSSGSVSSSNNSTYTDSSIAAYKNAGGTNSGLQTSYNNAGNRVSTTGNYGDDVAVSSAASEVAVAKALLGLTDSQAKQLQNDLEKSKQDFVLAQSDYEAAVKSGNTAAADAARAKMDAAHDKAQATRDGYGYTGDSDDYTDGGYYYGDGRPKPDGGGFYISDITPSYKITASANAGGTISPSGTVSVKKNTSQVFTVTPSTGYKIKSVTVDGADKGAVSTYTFSNVTAAHTITVAFEKLTNNITASAGTGGSISPSGSKSIAYGGSQTYTITPSTGYDISSVTVDGVNKGKLTSYTFSNVIGAHTISAAFTKKTYTISASAGTGGSISPSGSKAVAYGGSQTYTISPASGYDIERVTVDGANKGAVSSYTFSNVTGAHTISATFKPNGKISIGNVGITDALGADLSSGTIKSGYGIFANVSGNHSGVTNATMTMTYNFGQGSKTVTLQETSSGVFSFPKNSDSPTNKRCVYIPVETKDGSYTLTLTFTAKNAAGETLTETKTATVTVLGTMYEDDFTGNS